MNLSVGSRVRHPTFGVGTVLEVRRESYLIGFGADLDSIRDIHASFRMMEVLDEPIPASPASTETLPPALVRSHGIEIKRPLQEGRLLVEAIRSFSPAKWDGREAVTQMRSEGSTNWRQMEWIGFYFEHICERRLYSVAGGGPGPTFGRTRFDYQRDFVWDLKAHPKSGSTILIVNDITAIRACLDDRGHVGVVIIDGYAEYDDSIGSFKRWHDQMKGGTSAYEADRLNRGAPSRRRKVSFRPTDIYAVQFEGQQDLDQAIRDGWCNDRFQMGMRNSNGVARRAKLTIDTAKIPTKRAIR